MQYAVHYEMYRKIWLKREAQVTIQKAMCYKVLLLRLCVDIKKFTRSSLEKEHKTVLNARYLFNQNGQLVTTRLNTCAQNIANGKR